MIKQFRLAIIIGISLAIVVLLSFAQSQKQQNALHSQTFQGQNGWGYDILMRDRILIHQDVIPVINTLRGFKNQSQAEKAAALVIKKIRMKQFPQLTKSEIQILLSYNEAH